MKKLNEKIVGATNKILMVMIVLFLFLFVYVLFSTTLPRKSVTAIADRQSESSGKIEIENDETIIEDDGEIQTYREIEGFKVNAKND